jgi:hypothetical protein
MPNLPATLRAWFDDHPDTWFRCQEIAAELGYDRTHPVANECGRMHRKGQIARQRVPVKGRSQPITYYGHSSLVAPLPGTKKETTPA